MGNADEDLSDGFWDTDDDEEETHNLPSSSSSRLPIGRVIHGHEQASSSAGSCSSNLNLVSKFVSMGFSVNKVTKAIQENGEGNSEAILETLLTYSALEEPPPVNKQAFSDLSSESEGNVIDFSDMESDLGNEENVDPFSEKGDILALLVDMGYSINEASVALDKCGPAASLAELTDFICATQIAKETGTHLAKQVNASSSEDEQKPSHNLFASPSKKRSFFEEEEERRKRKRENYFRRRLVDEDETIHLPNPMIGFGIPSEPMPTVRRTLPHAAIGPPYFYYENVALAPKGVWKKMSSFLYEIEPEFVDSKYFSAAARKRGYIHNLPIDNRSPLLPIPPQTIHDAFPLTRKWWPWWDRRTKLNCVQTCTASAKLTEKIRKSLEDYGHDPPLKVQKYVVNECKKWNLVWVGKNKVAPLEPDEIETLLGFPKNHTRGGGICRTERLKGLGNSFQIDTVAFHLSVLRDMFPNGINVLSLFSGIGGAEVALHRLGIPLKNVVSVEISESSRTILRSWWESTNQRGKLIDITDVHLLDTDKLENLIRAIGGFDLVIGGSPCNNISGSNRVSRNGLDGKDSSLFFHYFRILNELKILMGR